MRQRSRTYVLDVTIATAIILTILIAALPAHGQAPTLGEQLAAQYKVAKMGSDSTGTQIVEEGTLLAVQKGGIVGTPYKSITTRTATFQDGTVRASDPGNSKAAGIGGKLCGLTHKCPTTPDAAKDENATKLFKVGDKVYATKIDIHPDKDQVVMGIVACDTCNKTDPPTYNKANVVFQFAKGSLASTPASTIEDTIGQLFTISDNNSDQGDQQQGQNQQQGQGQGQGQGGGGGQQQQTQTQTVQMGMSPDQVIGALGNPDQQFNIGPKQIFVYKTAGVKVTFFGGKVVDVQ
jgi:hypothetical protein